MMTFKRILTKKTALALVLLAPGALATATCDTIAVVEKEDFETRVARRWDDAERIYHQFLDKVAFQVNICEENSAKEELISRPVNVTYLQTLTSIDDFNADEAVEDVGSHPIVYMNKQKQGRINYNKFTPIALAVAMSRADLVEAWLPFIPDVNDHKLTGWGYRQPYTLAHFAVEPHPWRERPLNLQAARQVIDLLAAKGLDFQNYVNHDQLGIYTGLPLGAGNHRPHTLDPLTIRALLYGADPNAPGTSCHGTGRRLQKEPHWYWDDDFAQKLYTDAKKLVKGKKPIRPVALVTNTLEEQRVEELALLQSFSFLTVQD
ncbi:MAG: hypothetical protein C0514_02235 [Candidatus Puniceispirillum sp.]|nr:hypothetical protein [Candidatus Puniceispirillum sp.]